MGDSQRASGHAGVTVEGPSDRRPPADWPVSSYMAVLRQHAPDIYERYHVKSLGVFGSYVRNEQRPGSDLDLLVEFTEMPSLFRFIHLMNDLTDLLGVKVDLVMRDGLRPHIGRRILNEVVLL